MAYVANWDSLQIIDISAPAAPTITGDPVETFKVRVENLRQKFDIPGLSLAVRYRQQILLAEGFGYASLENKIPMGMHQGPTLR